MRDADFRIAAGLRPAGAAPAPELARDESDRFQPLVSGHGWRAVRPSIPRLESVIHETRIAQPDSGSVSGGRQHPSGTGRSDGGDLGALGRSVHSGGPRFDCEVAPGGYAWWYIDALSDDGRHGFTLIAFIGSVFSPYYARARRRASADPLNHCAVNVALYGSGAGYWAMTERGRAAVRRDRSRLVIGPSSIRTIGAP